MLFEYFSAKRKKGCELILKLLLFAVICISAFNIDAKHVYGYTAVRGTVTVKSGKARKEASTKSTFVFGITKDETVVIIGETTGDDGKLWYKVKVLNSVGYVRSDLVKKSNIEVKSESTIEIADGSDKSSNSDSKNTQNTQTASQTNTQNSDTQTGNTPTVKGTNVIVREEASTKAGIRTVVQPGQALSIISTDTAADGKDWCYVSFAKGTNNFKGYIRSDLINLNGVAKTTQTNNTESTQTAETANTANTTESSASNSPEIGKIKGTGVNIRKTPVDGKVVGRLNTGDQITCTGQEYSDKDQHVWYAVSFVYNKKAMTGYVRSDLTEGITDTSSKPAALAEETKNESQAETQNTQEQSAQQNTQTQTSETTASIKGTGVRIREKAVNGNIIAQLDTGYPVEVIEETSGSDNFTWYKIKFSKNDQEKEGYVRSDLVSIVSSNYQNALSDEDFEKSISEFPDAYKASLRALHEKYPNWKFVAVNTGLEWNDVVSAESTVGKNLVSKTSIASWKSTQPQAYNWETNQWYGFDGGSWAAASTELIQYYLDPRNFLDDSGIFQFETLGFEDYQNADGVRNLLSTTFMRGNYTDADGAERSYAETFYEAGNTFRISPYLLASRAVQEQGSLGASQSISGNVSGLENLFNYYNIGAYAANGRTATINGLYYAAGSDDNYYRPWNTRYKSIMGAAKYIADKYVSVGQNTLYFQKFNVVNKTNGIYSHQYMSNVVAASSESARLRKAYTDLNTTLVFRIPVYNNMPSMKCTKPTSDSNPNTYLKTLSVDGYGFTTSFSSVQSTYYVTVPQDVSSINVIAEPVSASSNINGNGTVELGGGENKIQVVCKAQSGATKIYTIIVYRN